MAATHGKQSKANYLFLAQTAEKVDRFDDMFNYAEQLVLVGPNLTLEERNLFWSACKNVIDHLRKSMSVLNNINYDTNQVKSRVEREIILFCVRVLNILEKHLIPSAIHDKRSIVFYMTMIGDFYRYEAEVMCGGKREQSAVYAEKAPKAAGILAKEFAPTDAIRLGSMLKFSTFQYKIMKNKKRAIRILKEVLEKASKHGEDADLVIGHMHKNLNSWESEVLIEEARGFHKLGEFVKRPFVAMLNHYKRKSIPNATPLEISFLGL